MPVWTQHILAILIVAMAIFALLRQGLATLRGRGGKLGSCCAEGCNAHANRKPPGERIVFLPVESLTRSRRP